LRTASPPEGFACRKLVSVILFLEQNEDGGYTVTVPSLPGCIIEGSTREEALAHIGEAIAGYVEVAKKLGKPIPVEISVPLNTTNARV